MIYKDCDNKEPLVMILERMLTLARTDKRTLIENALQTMRAGIRSERESASRIDFHLKDTTRTAVVHDLRLDLGDGGAAQIDHLLIHRTRRIQVLDTKHIWRRLKITDQGEFLQWNDNRKTYQGMPSPLAENECNVLVLREVLDRLGLSDYEIEPLILIAPNARIDRSRKYDMSRVVKADQFGESLNKSLESAPDLRVLVARLRADVQISIGDIAKKLIALHSPSTTDYMARFGVVPVSRPQPQAMRSQGLTVAETLQDLHGQPEGSDSRPMASTRFASKDESAPILRSDFRTPEKDFGQLLPWWLQMSEARQNVLANMCVNYVPSGC